MYCQYCGHELHNDAPICMNCGCPTDKYQASAPIATPTRPQSDQSTVASATTVTTPDNSPKKGIVALVLLFVLGQFGGHRFYAGRIGSAIGMLALFLTGYISMIVITYFKTILNKIYEPEMELPPTVDDSLTCVFGFLLLLAWFIWWIVDLVSLCSGKFRDGHGHLIKMS